MTSTLSLYGRLSGLLVVLTAIVGFNIGRWGLHRHPATPVVYVTGADPERGPALLRSYGCGACHTVPGVASAVGNVGPRLDRMNYQVYVAGILPNTPENLIHWIQDPKQADPQTVMPDLNVRFEDARDIAAYLYEIP